jgi:hypothetical protein
MEHLIARHAAERFSHDQFSNGFEKLFGLSGLVPDTLALSRLQELEADQIGLMLMGETGFDPQSAIDYLKDQIMRSWDHLSEDSHPSLVMDEWSGHPSVSQDQNGLAERKLTLQEIGERIAAMEPILLKTEALHRKRTLSNSVKILEWSQIRDNMQIDIIPGICITSGWERKSTGSLKVRNDLDTFQQ